MNKIAIETTITELSKNRIGDFLDSLIVYEKNAKADRKKLALTLPKDSDDFTVLKELPVLSKSAIPARVEYSSEKPFGPLRDRPDQWSK